MTMENKKEKVKFSCREDAEVELRRIIETDYNPCPSRNKKPVRSYEYKGEWYLTSKPLIY
jgi:hypothetical protein